MGPFRSKGKNHNCLSAASLSSMASCKYSLLQKFKFVIIFTLCIWFYMIFNIFFTHNAGNKARSWEFSKQDALIEQQKLALLSENLKHTFINSEEWVNVSKNLQDIWSRLNNLEITIEKYKSILNMDPPLTTDNESEINQSLCQLTDVENRDYPSCTSKTQWMENFWKTDQCYKDYDVDGSLCSIRRYLSEIENWCPLLPLNLTQNSLIIKTSSAPARQAKWNKNLSGLMDIMREPPSRNNYEWILNRIVRLWHLWAAAVESMMKEEQQPRTQKNILVYLGFLSRKSGFKFQQTVSAGGPLGELVQWSDILSALYILGHQMTITSEYEELTGMLNTLPNIKSQCQGREQLPFDMIVTDIVGLTHFKRHVRQGYGKFSCLLRIIDTFGTEAGYNNPQFAKKNKKYKTSWGMQELNLKQFYTMFPHSPDNSFMGFVVEQFLNSSELKSVKKKQQAVVYGKSQHMWNGKEEYLQIISKHVSIHGTVYTKGKEKFDLPHFVVNHGILSGPDLQRLLLESKLFIGLGFPYEGPAPLEAIAAGCVFINPKFSPPHSSKNTKFFKGKPTGRELTSQHPYAQDYIAQPNVFTVDISNLEEVEKTVQLALELVSNKTVKPYLPFEFTHKGMLQRLNSYLEHQNFCPPNNKLWPPERSITVVVSQTGQSCKDACWSNKLICEPTHFPNLNKKDVFEKYLPSECKTFTIGAGLYYPALDNKTKTCYIQSDNMLFSCIDSDLVRLCPCRKFIRGQMALCPDCL